MNRIAYDNPAWWQRLSRRIAASPPGTWFLARTLHRMDGPVLRATDGRYSVASLVAGLPIISLTTTGAKSGQPRTVPLIAIPDDGRLILIASNWGSGKRPAWYYNATANPEVTVTAGGQSSQWQARELDGAEREAAWGKAAAVYPGYEGYARRLGERGVPVLLLTRSE